jgi:hypothetical protein
VSAAAARWLAGALLLLAPGARAAEAYGVAGGDGEGACLAIARPLHHLPRLLRVMVTAPDRRALQAQVVARLEHPCRALANAGLTGAFYALRPASAGAGPWLGIADFGAHPHAVLRACTSTEGVHLEVRDRQGRRLWHRYVYLGYDVDPTCTPDESGA